MQLPNSEDGKKLAAYIDIKLDELKKELLKELKPKTPKK